jgi:uncharacterized protein
MSTTPEGLPTLTPFACPPGLEPALFAALEREARARAEGSEPAHDFFHVARVHANAVTLARAEGADEAVCAVAALLHELFTLPKSHPDSSKAGDVCAEHARALLERTGAPPDVTSRACEAIRDHAFSKGVVPGSLEARILQDADRLDALGAIGLARMWATCADMKRPFYAPVDPFCDARAPDDKAWGLDHVFKKLLVVPERLHTAAARKVAAERTAFLHAFLDQLRGELAGG